LKRVAQSVGNRGSLKWLQIAVNERTDVLNREVNARATIQGKIEWLSPLRSDDYAEYKDSAFLDLVGCSSLRSDLAGFWPERGPQWDALACTDRDEVLIVEAKAHIPEFFSPPSRARPESRAKIDKALDLTASFLNAKPIIPWGVYFYQLTNRLAHLMFLRERKVNASLVLLNFLGDVEMGGPQTAAEWESAYAIAAHVLGLSKNHKLSSHVLHAYVDVRSLGG
jgi:hypothetical protein